MFATLLWKELLDHLISLRFTITCLLCFFVLLNSFVVRSADYVQLSTDFAKDAALERAAQEQVRYPWDVQWNSRQIRQAPNPLKIFVRGVSDANGFTVRMRGTDPVQIVRNERATNTSVKLFPPIDLVAFVGLIMSLMAILFGYDAVCGEKQQGTLRLMLSYAVPRDTVLMVKWLGGLIALLVPYGFAVVAMIAIIMINQSIALTDQHWLQLAAIFGLSVLYLAVIYSLALWVSCLTHRASTSIMLLVALWVVLFLATPNLAPYIAQQIHPLKNAHDIERDRFDSRTQIWQRVYEEPTRALNKKLGLERGWWRTIDWSDWEQVKPVRERDVQRANWAQEAIFEILALYDKIETGLNANSQQQVRITRRLSRLSPYGSFAMASAELAGEGPDQRDYFLKQARQYHNALMKWACVEDVAANQYRLDTQARRIPALTPDKIAAIPRFNFVPPVADTYFRGVLLDAGILAGVMVVSFLLSYMAFLRYDVR